VTLRLGVKLRVSAFGSPFTRHASKRTPTRSDWAPDEEKRLLDLHNGGKSHEGISQVLVGRTPAAVRL